MELEQDLRATSDNMLRRLDRLRELELEKRKLEPGSDRFIRIARDIERLAAMVLNNTQEQEQLAQATAAVQESADVALPPIEQVTPLRDIQQILNEWREAERRLAAASAGTPDHLEAQAAVHRLRAEYRQTYRSLIADQPPPVR
jgi:hypothetical protein